VSAPNFVGLHKPGISICNVSSKADVTKANITHGPSWRRYHVWLQSCTYKRGDGFLKIYDSDLNDRRTRTYDANEGDDDEREQYLRDSVGIITLRNRSKNHRVKPSCLVHDGI
jgi:hypothetical protein